MSKVWRALVFGMASGFAACSAEQGDPLTDSTVRGSENVGELGLALALSPGTQISSVDYAITGGGIVPIHGVIPVADNGSTISATIGGIPAGVGYRIELHGVSTTGSTTCDGAAPFAVVANQTSQVLVDFICVTGSGSGSTGIGTKPDNCPVLNFLSVAPAAVSVGGHIAVSAAATDPEGHAVTFAWTATPPLGTFGSATSASTTFTCVSGGTTELRVAASDGLCVDDAKVTVTCVNVLCGNGQVDPGETCDDGNVSSTCDACPQDCTLAACGDGKVECPEPCDDANTNPLDNCDLCGFGECGDGRVNGNEQCDGGPLCNSRCESIVCGDGRLDPPEGCDPPGAPLPSGFICGPVCQPLPVACVCGDGVICPSGGEQCETPNSPGNVSMPSGTAQGCGATCQSLLSNACVDCEANSPSCSDYRDGCENPILNTPATSGPAMGTSRKALCYETAECVRRTGCASGPTGVLGCFCGTADSVTCLSGSPAANGACRAELERSLETTSAVTAVALNFIDPTYGGGFWMGRLACLASDCSGLCP